MGARRFLRTCASTGDPQPFGPCEIRRRQDGLAVGGVAFHGLADDRGIVTIGYSLVPSAQGGGYATEALRALLGFARDNGVTGVEGDTDHQNAASQRVMNAVGNAPGRAGRPAQVLPNFLARRAYHRSIRRR
ncbi:GNAT family N-acetyltransferase [Streptomyces cyaneofuscatus]|uniref:GNAT family N-acetyltransferase n=1 Tax=Streptomyces cyaneofuscatus TaxID=66883 RepID=UPI00364FB0CB